MIYFLATAALLVTGVASQVQYSKTSQTTCMSCVAADNYWISSPKACYNSYIAVTDVTVPTAGTGFNCYKINQIPTFQNQVYYDSSTEFSTLAPISASLNSYTPEIYISYANMQSSPLTFSISCSGNALYAYSYTGALPNIEYADFDCSNPRLTVQGNS